MKQITVNGLWAMLHGIQGSTMVGFTAETQPKMRKGGNPYYGCIVKRNTFNGVVNFHYDEGVLRRLEKEGKSPDEFRQGTSWHEPVCTPDNKLTPLCKHKKEQSYYLRFMELSTGKPVFLDTRNGNEVPKSTLADYIPKGSDYSNQGLDDPLKIRTIALGNIRKISIKGEEYEVI